MNCKTLSTQNIWGQNTLAVVFCRCWDYNCDFLKCFFFSCIPNFLQRTRIPFIIYLLINLTNTEWFYEPVSNSGCWNTMTSNKASPSFGELLKVSLGDRAGFSESEPAPWSWEGITPSSMLWGTALVRRLLHLTPSAAELQLCDLRWVP